MTVPLRHFLVALGFLLLGGLVGIASALDVLSWPASLAHVHLLLAGWVCVTIMGAMTQFVPVWSGASLHSRRLASAQLWLVGLGLLGFAACLLAERLALAHAPGGLVLLGLWVFVYNVGRTLARVDGLDVTERHFAVALGFFAVLPTLGFLLAMDWVSPVFTYLPVTRPATVGAHATLAVFGAILTTVFGALYQLATMFTQTDLHGIDRPLRRLEEVGYPTGVVALTAGRLFDVQALGLVGGLLVVASVLAISVILARRLYETQVDWTPMLSRYAVLAPAMAAWALLTAPTWLRDPLAVDARFGAPGTVHLLTVGVIGFVVLGTLYHIVPFIVWVHRYSDLLGYESVPMIDDLYSDRVARIDLVVFVLGTALLVAGDLLDVPAAVSGLGGACLLVGTGLVGWNLLGVIRQHSPHSLAGVLGLPSLGKPSPEDPAGGSDRS